MKEFHDLGGCRFVWLPTWFTNFESPGGTVKEAESILRSGAGKETATEDQRRWTGQWERWVKTFIIKMGRHEQTFEFQQQKNRARGLVARG